MKKCSSESLIDDYLLNRLGEDASRRYEEHYFNCSSCFQETEARAELISAVKSRGRELFFQDSEARESVKSPWATRLTGLMAPRVWTLAAASAALVLILILGILPSLKTKAPQFFVNDDLVRGDTITLISPVIDVREVPSTFRWSSLGKDVEYKIDIYNDDLMWSHTTRDNFILLPKEVKEKMKAGEKYSWQVKAFSPQGSLQSISSRVHFKLDASE